MRNPDTSKITNRINGIKVTVVHAHVSPAFKKLVLTWRGDNSEFWADWFVYGLEHADNVALITDAITTERP